MVSGGAMPVGSSRILRLDPLVLPIRFTAHDAGADALRCEVEILRDRVILRRAVRGIPMTINVAMNAYLGVALRLIPSDRRMPDLLEVSLAHRDHALSIPLLVAADSDNIIADWQLWARVLRRPLLIANPDGTYRDPFPRMGDVRIGQPTWRRRRRNAIKSRRPSFLLRRRQGRIDRSVVVHRSEREIIARN